MNSLDFRGFARCIIDYPLELTESEISSLAGPVNTLLKSSFLLGSYRDLDSVFQAFFDIAEEIESVDCCGYFAWEGDPGRFKTVAARHMPSNEHQLSSSDHPASIARHFGKAILLDSSRDTQLAPYCEIFSATSVLIFPLRRDREIIGALLLGKRGEKPFLPVAVKLLWVLAMQAENYLLQSEVVKALSFYSFIDPLTHLYNRRYFDNQLEKEILRSRRSGKSFSLLMLDLASKTTTIDSSIPRGTSRCRNSPESLSIRSGKWTPFPVTGEMNSPSSSWRATRKELGTLQGA
jgi:predicted signal transduction protein with EAL and GGDEF domain